MNITPILKEIGIDPSLGQHRAVYDIGKHVYESKDFGSAANKIIMSLGGERIPDDRRAVYFSQALIEQAVINPIDFDPVSANAAASARCEKLFKDLPWLIAKSENPRPTNKPKTNTTTKSGAPRAKRSDPKNNDKKAKAKAIFDLHKDKSNGEIAKIIEKELEITYANAYYYTSRVFKR